MPLQTEPYDSVDYLTDADSISYFLQEAMENGDVHDIARALDTVVRAHGFARLAQDTGMPYRDIVRALNADNRNHLGPLLKLLDALGIKSHTKNAA